MKIPVESERIARCSLQIFHRTRRIRARIIPRRRFHYDLLAECRYVLHDSSQRSVRARRYRRILRHRLARRPGRTCVFERNRPIYRLIRRVRRRDRRCQGVRRFRQRTHPVILILTCHQLRRRKLDSVAHTCLRAHLASAAILRLLFSARRVLHRRLFRAPIIMVLQQSAAHPARQNQRQRYRDPAYYLLYCAFACLFYCHFIFLLFPVPGFFYCCFPSTRQDGLHRPAFVED